MWLGLEYPNFGVQLGSAFQDSLLPLSILLIIGVTVFCAYCYWFKVAREPVSITPEDRSLSVTRRAFLPLLITGVGVIGLGYSLVRQRRNTRPSQAPPSTHRRRARSYTSNLKQGFYINPKSEIIHYVEKSRRIRCVSWVDEARLRQWDSTAASIDKSKPRVNKSCASYSFEQAAVSYLRLNNLDKGFQLLFLAITQEILLMKARKKEPKTPSFRLYDLVAGLSVRFDRRGDLERMIGLIEGTDPDVKKLFLGRVGKWNRTDSRWYQRWSGKSTQLEWKVDESSGLVF